MYALAGDVEHTVDLLNDATGIKLPPAWPDFAIAVAYTWRGDHVKAREYYEKSSPNRRKFLRHRGSVDAGERIRRCALSQDRGIARHARRGTT